MIFKPLEADDLKDAINSLGLPGGEEALCLCRRVRATSTGCRGPSPNQFLGEAAEGTVDQSALTEVG